MGLRDELRLLFRGGRIDLVVPYELDDDPVEEAWVPALDGLMTGHRHLLMTDPDLLDEPELRAATVVEARDPVPEAVAALLVGRGFEVEITEGAGGGGRNRRSQLEHWVLAYERATFGSDAKLAELEAALDEGTFESFSDAFGAVYRQSVGPDLEGVGLVERTLGIRAADRLVLAPRLIEGWSDFVSATIAHLRPDVERPSPEAPVLTLRKGDEIMETDPQFRVVEHVIRGPRASLVGYLRSLLA